jgi:hypothetical protein
VSWPSSSRRVVSWSSLTVGSADAVAAGSLVEGAVLERAQVAVDGRLGGADLAADGGELGGVSG